MKVTVQSLVYLCSFEEVYGQKFISVKSSFIEGVPCTLMALTISLFRDVMTANQGL